MYDNINSFYNSNNCNYSSRYTKVFDNYDMEEIIMKAVRKAKAKVVTRKLGFNRESFEKAVDKGNYFKYASPSSNGGKWDVLVFVPYIHSIINFSMYAEHDSEEQETLQRFFYAGYSETTSSRKLAEDFIPPLWLRAQRGHGFITQDEVKVAHWGSPHDKLTSLAKKSSLKSTMGFPVRLVVSLPKPNGILEYMKELYKYKPKVYLASNEGVVNDVRIRKHFYTLPNGYLMLIDPVFAKKAAKYGMLLKRTYPDMD